MASAHSLPTVVPVLPPDRVAVPFDVSLRVYVADSSRPDVLCHEMLHAFRDAYMIRLSSFEEGMVRAAEIEIFNRLAQIGAGPLVPKKSALEIKFVRFGIRGRRFGDRTLLGTSKLCL